MPPNLRCLNLPRLAVFSGAVWMLGCSSASSGTSGPLRNTPSLQACDTLDLSQAGPATIKAFAEAALALQGRADDLEGKWAGVCQTLNYELGLDVSKTSTAEACAVLSARVMQAVAAGAQVSLSIVGNCTTDIDAHAACEAKCQLPANCDFNAQCTGDLLTACDGACSGACDVQAGSDVCNGTCKGTCSAVDGVTCAGICDGACDGGSFDASCDAGCSSGFAGSCAGTCSGLCDAAFVDGPCAGQCVGSCSAGANGACASGCAAGFRGTCSAHCSGSCSDDAGVACTGACLGTCSARLGASPCSGECHGDCAAPTSPAICTGAIECPGADCFGACQAEIAASTSCSQPSVAVLVAGDLELERALEEHQTAWGELVGLTRALYPTIQAIGDQALSAIPNAGTVTSEEQRCFIATFDAISEAVISINSSNQASATIPVTATSK